jgi:5-methylcytosine-specific restriction endonuclease McrA
MSVQTAVGERALSRAETERMQCDAAVSRPNKRNTTTIPPRTRREVLARDKHRCRAPGCGRTRFLEVHHITPRSAGGGNQRGNLLTLCGSCHRLWHEKGNGSVVGTPSIPYRME